MTRTKNTFLTLIAVLLSPMAANADLITDSVYGCASNPGFGCTVNGTGHNWFQANSGAGVFAGLNSGDTAIVSDPGVEFYGGGSGTFGFGFSADLGNDYLTIALDFLFPGPATFVSQEWIFSGLDWVGSTDGAIDGLTLSGGNLAIGDFSFTDNSIRLLTPNLSVGAGATRLEANFQISTTHTAIPEPGTLALLGIGLFGMGLARRRRQA